jgi:serine/threonine-protein kinase
MLTGQLPFEADTPWLWAHKHMTEPPRPMESFEAGQKLPEAVRRAVMHALEKTPIQRPSTTLELYRELAGGKTTEDMMPDAGHTEPGNDGPRTSPMPAVPPMTTPGGPAASPAFHTASALAAPVRAQPPVRRKRRGWIALAGLLVAGGALAAGVVAFERARSVGPAPEGAGGTLSVAGSSTTQIAPLVDAAPATVSVPAPEPPVVKTSAPAPARTPAQPAKKPEKPEPPVASSPAPQLPPISLPAPQPSATASKPPRFPQITLPQLNLPTRPAPQPKPAPPKPTGPTGNAACAQASSLASGGNIEGAVAMYNRCRSTGGSANAQRTAAARIRTRAPVVVKQRAYLGNCAGARSAASAASSIGVGAPAQAALAGTKC